MAQSNNPNSPRRDELDDLGDTRKIERSGGGWRWWWAWAVVIAVACWWAAFGWGGSGGFWRGSLRSATRDNPQNGAIENRALRDQPANSNANNPGAVASAAPHFGANAGNTANTAAGAQPQTSGPGLVVLEAPNKQQYVGKTFQADDVPVQKKVSTHVMWVGTGDTKPTLAVVQGDANDPDYANIQLGELINAKGTVQKAPSASQAEQQWHLSDQDAQLLDKEGAYIQISQLQTPQPQ